MHRSYRAAFALLSVVTVAKASTVYAGMPKGLPTEVPRVLQLSTPALERFQTISFFLFIFTICAATVMVLWNYLQRDFPKLPRLTFGRAAAGVFLWGLLFVTVLTMISGARESMTPRAWEQRGYTYQIAEPPSPTAVEPTTVSSQEVGP